MLKKIFKISGIILLVGFISVFVKGYIYQETKTNQKDNLIVDSSSNEKQELIDEDIITSILDNKEDQEVLETKQEEIAPEVKQEVVIQKENTSQPKQEVQTFQNNKVEVQTSTTPEVVVPQPKQPTEWEKLGISEYDLSLIHI